MDWSKWVAHKSNKDLWIEEQEKMRELMPQQFRSCPSCGRKTTVRAIGKRAMAENSTNIVCNRCQLIVAEGD